MDTPVKRCKVCQQLLPITSFYYSKAHHAYVGKCKRCYQIAHGHTPREVLPEGFKRCDRCKRVLPKTPDYFNAYKRAKDGRQSRCRDCQKELKQEWHKTQGQSPEQKQKARRRATLWYMAHPETATKRYAKDPAKVLATQHRRKARKLNLPDAFTDVDWQACLRYFHNRCAYCGNPPGLFHFTTLCIDHWIPLASKDCSGTIPTNIVPACKICNSSKNDSDPQAWLIDKFGKARAKRITSRVLEYFSSIS